MKHFILILAAIVFSTGLSLAQTQDSTSAVLQENLPETQMTKKEIRNPPCLSRETKSQSATAGEHL